MSEVSVFQEDEKDREDRIIRQVEGGVLRVDKAQEALGLEIDTTQDVYLRDSRLIAVRANERSEPTPEPAGNGGAPTDDELAEFIALRSRFRAAGSV